MRLRGYSLMTNVLEDYTSDVEMITLVRAFRQDPLIDSTITVNRLWNV